MSASAHGRSLKAIVAIYIETLNKEPLPNIVTAAAVYGGPAFSKYFVVRTSVGDDPTRIARPTSGFVPILAASGPYVVSHAHRLELQAGPFLLHRLLFCNAAAIQQPVGMTSVVPFDEPLGQLSSAELQRNIALEDIPPNLAEVLQRFDQNGDGNLNIAEIERCVQILDCLESGRFPITSLNPDLKDRFLESSLKLARINQRPSSSQRQSQVAPDDTESQQFIELSKIIDACESLALQEKSKNDGSLSFSLFPPKVVEELKELDSGGDGSLDADEILSAIRALRREREKTKQLIWAISGLFLMVLVLLGAMSGLLFLVVDMTKDSRLSSSGVMVAKGTNNAVQVASSDFTVINGVLIPRSSTNQTCTGGVCPRNPVQVTQVFQEAKLSSQLDDATLVELSSLKLVQGTSFVHFQVLAVARYAERASRYGSVVVIYTHIGEITLDGEAITFHEALKGAFSRAGFSIDVRGRRLLGIVEILGMFKMLKSSLNQSSDQNRTSGGYPNELPVMLPTTFAALVEETEFCEDENGVSTSSCESPGVGLVNWVSEPLPGRKALQLLEKQYSLTIDGRHVAKNVQTKAQWPGQALVKIYNETHKMTFQTYQGRNYHCKVVEDKSLKEVVAARRVLDAPQSDMSVNFRGFITVEGVYCKCFVVTIRNPSGPAQIVTIYEDYVNRRLYQLEYKSIVWRFISLVPVLNEASNPLPTADFNMNRILNSCDEPDREPPTLLIEGQIANIVSPDPVWGSLIEAPSEGNSTARRVLEDLPRILTMEEYVEWKKSQDSLDHGGNGTTDDRVRQSCSFFSFPRGYHSTIIDLKRNKKKASSSDPTIWLAYQVCGSDISLHAAGSAGFGCPTVSGGIDVVMSGLLSRSPTVGISGYISALVNVCRCPPFVLPRALAEYCPILTVTIAGNTAVPFTEQIRGSGCRLGNFPRNNIQLSGEASVRVGGWLASARFAITAYAYLGLRCSSRQVADSRVQIGHRYAGSVELGLVGLTKTFSIDVWPTEQVPCGSQRNPITGNSEYIFKPSDGSSAYSFFEFDARCRS